MTYEEYARVFLMVPAFDFRSEDLKKAIYAGVDFFNTLSFS